MKQEKKFLPEYKAHCVRSYLYAFSVTQAHEPSVNPWLTSPLVEKGVCLVFGVWPNLFMLVLVSVLVFFVCFCVLGYSLHCSSATVYSILPST